MTLCSDDEMRSLMAAMQQGTGDELALAEGLIATYPEDARLHFLRGSLLAGSGRPIEAHAALSRAVAITPDFLLARFQLGFFELTSGEPARALATWAPLTALASDHYLRLMVEGLTHLIHDRFDDTIAVLRSAIAANDENAPLNQDMGLIIARCEEARAVEPEASTSTPEASATSFLLGQLGGFGTRH